jgi:hypothetical protein
MGLCEVWWVPSEQMTRKGSQVQVLYGPPLKYQLRALSESQSHSENLSIE